ncbi:STAS domain-containing protein [Geodermatophilus sp. FMUSA9-8]|uniref:STAS domain-containing protein n=1 Tax=Geodermatophilus sp. FMUSA9-8 TaxID=3120155 RepID=UPI003009AD93
MCDVSYVFTVFPGAAPAGVLGPGSRFRCSAVTGEVVDWAPRRRIGTRLELAQETWQTLFELADVGTETTDVTVTVTCEPVGGNRLQHALRSKSVARRVTRTVDSELAKLPDHIRQLSTERPQDSAVEDEPDGLVLHLRGHVGPSAVEVLRHDDQPEGRAVVAVDVSEVTHIDAVAFSPLLRWAQRVSRAGRPAVVRGDNPSFDEMLGVMGLASTFRRAP